MSKSLSITVYPSALGAEYLSVSDAMRQVLDLVEVLECAEKSAPSDRQIIWRLTEAHTNSPPFTITAEAFPLNPTVSVAYSAAQVIAVFSDGLKSLLEGDGSGFIDSDAAQPLRRVMRRNQNGIGRTEVTVPDAQPFNVVPMSASIAMAALDRIAIEAEISVIDYRRTEYGSVEAEVCGLSRWNDRPAIIVMERLSGNKVTCVLSDTLAESMGVSHKWHEAWDGRRLLISGALHYGKDGSLKRIDAECADDMPWTDVTLADLRDIDLLQGRSVTEHLNLIRGGDRGETN